jgi:hypothetical protein
MGKRIGLSLCSAAVLAACVVQGASAQEARDIFKTEIFLTPYSELGDGQDTYPRLNGRFLLMTGYTGFFGIKDDNGQIPRSHWSSVQPTAEAALVLQLTREFSIRTKATFNSSTNETKDNA